MFSGIIETTSQTLSILPDNRQDLIRFKVSRPTDFQDLHIGDSVAMNGVCLTVEAFDRNSVQFAMALETLQVTGWTKDFIEKARWNMERSLRFGDRIHGHLVTGHVDFKSQVTQADSSEELREIWIRFPSSYEPYFWRKGSVTLNGVSLTINEVENHQLRVNLIPETLRATNLGELNPGDSVNVEVDAFARGLIHYFKERNPRGTPLR